MNAKHPGTEPGSGRSAPQHPGGSTSVHVRRAVRTDVAAIIAIFAEDAVGGHGDRLTPQSLPIYLAAFDAIDTSPSDRLFVAELDGAVVGTYQFTLCRTLVHQGRLRAMVEAVHVAGARRGQGIGAAMMRHAQSIAREAGAGVLELTSNKQRHDAHRFYERLGFRRSHDGFKLALD